LFFDITFHCFGGNSLIFFYFLNLLFRFTSSSLTILGGVNLIWLISGGGGGFGGGGGGGGGGGWSLATSFISKSCTFNFSSPDFLNTLANKVPRKISNASAAVSNRALVSRLLYVFNS
jgi:hypothetical protein